jgi:hypothetical protein
VSCKCVISDDVVLKEEKNANNKHAIATHTWRICMMLTIETPSDEDPNKMLLDSNCDTQARVFIAESGL